jgi:hypothetical protein
MLALPVSVATSHASTATVAVEDKQAHRLNVQEG